MANKKLVDHCKNNYESRAKCAEALGISYQHLHNLIAQGCEVVELASGQFMTLTKYNKLFKTVKVKK